jgi:glycerol uptake facilitator-like aquaporin
MTETRVGLSQRLAAEYIGTFALIFIGARAAVAVDGLNSSFALTT